MKETPNHIKNRLESVGLRSINLIVDISNYVMLELGIPNHIFDRSKLSGDRVMIKRAEKTSVLKLWMIRSERLFQRIP